MTTGSTRRAKRQSNHHPINLFQAGCPSCHPTNSVKALKAEVSHSKDLLTPSSPAGLPTLSLTTKAPGYLGEVCQASHQPLKPVPQ